MTDLRIGDPVTDLANGRSMVIVNKADERADDWSERNNYDLLDNYGNERLGAQADDSVWTCVYVSSMQSEPSKTYDFPESRLGRPAYERADGDGRIYDRVARDVLERLFTVAGSEQRQTINRLASEAGIKTETVDTARELAEVTGQFDNDESVDPSSGGSFET